MAIARNLVASYASQLLITVISIGAVPLYLRYMGLEPYGLVGLFLTLQAWFGLLDIGLSPTMLRQAARFRSGAIDADAFRDLLRAMEVIFVALGTLIALGMAAAAYPIAVGWLNPRHLSAAEVTAAVIVMAPTLGLRFVATLYRSTINGMGLIIWLSGLNLGIAVLRFAMVIPVLMFVDPSPVAFFAFQLGVSVVETGLLVWMTYRHGPSGRARPAWSALREVVGFSASVAFTGIVWSVVNQSDKLILSKLLSLRDFALFTLATLVAGGVLIMSTPAGPSLIPRLTAHDTAGDRAALTALYRRATRLIVLLAGTAGLALALFADPLLFAWSGDRALAAEAAPVTALYALGNVVVAVASMPIYLQFAVARMRLHVLGQALLLVTIVPAIAFAATHGGMVAIGQVWLIVNGVYLLLWVPLIHARRLPGAHLPWLLGDVVGTAMPAVAVGLVVATTVRVPHDRWLAGLYVVGAAGTMLSAAALCQPWVRDQVRPLLRRFSQREAVPAPAPER